MQKDYFTKVPPENVFPPRKNDFCDTTLFRLKTAFEGRSENDGFWVHSYEAVLGSYEAGFEFLIELIL